MGRPNRTMQSPGTLALAICVTVLCAMNGAGAADRGVTRCASAGEQPIFTQQGLATWYGGRSVGHRTASGEPMARHALSAAHRTLAFGSIVRVTNLENGRTVTVTINDRGPSGRRNHRRILDISKAAAVALGMTGSGVMRISLEKCLSDQPSR